MSSFYDEFNSVFWLSLATMILGSFAVCLKYCYQSKCQDILLCYGLINIHRDIDVEAEIDEQKTQIPNNEVNI
jgi:hypothetical protein